MSLELKTWRHPDVTCLHWADLPVNYSPALPMGGTCEHFKARCRVYPYLLWVYGGPAPCLVPPGRKQASQARGLWGCVCLQSRDFSVCHLKMDIRIASILLLLVALTAAHGERYVVKKVVKAAPQYQPYSVKSQGESSC
ncbi:hypothetical protein N1851_022480 [Merluccius polli]|uniref:Uncharacterized protein n=1 Tax=Merluccius polli TaxID=89951 RepID=A0AA47MHR6_MERPO|nr:hypothetical protein N1851_022480 [Merluccius polli]